MAVNWGKTISKSFLFSVHPKRWLPFFAIDMAAVMTILFVIFRNGLQDMVISLSPLPSSLLHVIVYIVATMLVWALANTWITGAVVHQSSKEKEFRKSWHVASVRLPSLIAIMFVVGAISSVLSLVPYVSIVFSIIIGTIFIFANQAVMVGGKGFYEALEESYGMFRKKAMYSFLTWLLASLFSMAIAVVFLIPLMTALVISMFQYSFDMSMLAWDIKNNLYLYIALGAVFLVGVALARVFSLKFQTEAYTAGGRGKIRRLLKK